MCSACQRNKRGKLDGPPAVPADFWSAELIQRSLQEWHMGRVIAAYRTHPYHPRPLPQELVASWLGITQAQLSRIENGDPITDLSKLTDWAVLLGVPAHLLWFRLPGSKPSAQASRGNGSPSSHVSQLADDAAASSMHFARTTAETGLAAEAVEHLRWEVERLAVDYVHAPLHVVFDELLALRDAIFELLGKRHRPRDARQLYRMAGLVCSLLAQGSTDSGNHRAAKSQLQAAWMCAQLCEDDSLRAWVHGTAAVSNHWAGHAAKAIDHAVRGAQFSSSPTSRIRLALIEARSAATFGNREQAGAALVQHQRILEKPPYDDSVTPFRGFFDFPEAKQHFYTGTTRQLIGQHAPSMHAALAAIAAYKAGPADERSYGDEAIARVDIINARIALDDFAGADHALGPLIDLPSALRISTLHTALDRTRSMLNNPRFTGAKAIQTLRDRLATYHEESAHQQKLLASTA